MYIKNNWRNVLKKIVIPIHTKKLIPSKHKTSVGPITFLQCWTNVADVRGDVGKSYAHILC